MKSKFILFALALIACTASYAKELCSDASSHADQRACLVKAERISAAEVKNAQETHRKVILAWDDETSFIQQSLKLFNVSVREYARFRRAQCEYEASAAGGGNGAGDMRLNCQISLDVAYLKSLKDKVHWFPGRNG